MDRRAAVALLAVAVFAIAQAASAQLEVGFYGASCTMAESIVRHVVAKRFREDPSVTAALLRMYFHDCFPNGCDASILLDSTSKQSSEKDAGVNRSVRGYDIIEEVKAALEAACPSTVSCADVVALATRDAVRLAGGPAYEVPTGRRDSLGSNQNDADNLPEADMSVASAVDLFDRKGFTPEEFVVLMGGHTVGVAHCFFVEPHAAPMDRGYRANFSRSCGARGKEATMLLEQSTPFVVDNNFYSEVLAKKAPLTMDRLLASDKKTAPMVQRLASNPGEFLAKFGPALVKLGNLDVLTGTAGQIRRKCNTANAPQPKAAAAAAATHAARTVTHVPHMALIPGDVRRQHLRAARKGRRHSARRGHRRARQ